MTTGTKYLANVASLDEVEALAVLKELHLTMEVGICPVQVEIDSMRVFQLLIREGDDLSETSLIINRAKSYYSINLHASYLFTQWDKNGVAHLLAQRALASSRTNRMDGGVADGDIENSCI